MQSIAPFDRFNAEPENLGGDPGHNKEALPVVIERGQPVDEPRPWGEAEGLPLQSDPYAAGTVTEVGRLGAALLHHELPHHRHSRCWAQRQARSHHRDMGPPEGTRTPRDGARTDQRCRLELGPNPPAVAPLDVWQFFLIRFSFLLILAESEINGFFCFYMIGWLQCLVMFLGNGDGKCRIMWMDLVLRDKFLSDCWLTVLANPWSCSLLGVCCLGYELELFFRFGSQTACVSSNASFVVPEFTHIQYPFPISLLRLFIHSRVAIAYWCLFMYCPLSRYFRG